MLVRCHLLYMEIVSNFKGEVCRQWWAMDWLPFDEASSNRDSKIAVTQATGVSNLLPTSLTMVDIPSIKDCFAVIAQIDTLKYLTRQIFVIIMSLSAL